MKPTQIDMPGSTSGRISTQGTVSRLGFQKLAEFLVVATCTLVFAFTSLGVVHSLLQRDAAGKRDFVEYWAAGVQLAHHANPYDAGALLAIERSAGLPAGIPVMLVRSPPFVLPLLAPLGHHAPLPAELCWCFALLLVLLLSIWMVRRLHGRRGSAVDLLALFFAPALCCLLTGQMSMLMLLGIALFTYFHQRRPLLAGVGLAFCMVKPHLLLPFAAVLLLWMIHRRSYRVLAGAGLMLATAAAIAYSLDPHAWAQCAALARESRAETVPLPCLSFMLRRTLAPGALWVQYLLPSLGSVWAILYYLRHRLEWDWMEHGSLVTIVSLTVAPYSWFTDHVMLIPALLYALYISRSRTLTAVFALANAGVQLSIFGGGTRMLHSVWMVWIAPFWLAWYLLAVRSARQPAPVMSEVALTLTEPQWAS